MKPMKLNHKVTDEQNKINIIDEDKKVEILEDKPNSSTKASSTSKEILDLYNMVKKDEQIEKPKPEIDPAQTQKIADLIFQDLEFSKSEEENAKDATIKEEELVKKTDEIRIENVNEKQPETNETNTDIINKNNSNLKFN
jgi:hypothetical protein